MKKAILIICILQIFSASYIYAQSAINASNKSIKTAHAHHDYSIGEMTLVHTASNKHIIITQGYLQPKETNKPQITLNNTAVNIYPNPTLDIVYLDFFTAENCDAEITILDANGKIILQSVKNNLVGNQKIPISMQAFANGMYLLKVVFKNEFGIQQSNYKIQKQ
jgi:branched-subunit amino acid permease